MEELRISISSPGGPGTSLIDSIKKMVLEIFMELDKHENFGSLNSVRMHLTRLGMRDDYLRNIFPFLQNIGFINYANLNPFQNKDLFTNLGKAFIDIRSSIEIAEQEEDSETKEDVIKYLGLMEQSVILQGMKRMMMSKSCRYASDYFDVLRFVNKYNSIDLTEYFLLIYERNRGEEGYLDKINETIQKYRQGKLNIIVTTEIKKNIKKTQNATGAPKRINTFPYIKGSFLAAGIFSTTDDDRCRLNEAKRQEIDSVLREIEGDGRLQ